MEQKFGDWIRYHRKRHGWTQREVGRMIGVGQTTIANYEINIRFPDQQILVALARLFNASLDELMGLPPLQSKPGPDKAGEAELPAVEDTLTMLTSGDSNEVWKRIENAIARGISLATLYETLFEPLLTRTGTLWASGRWGVAEEHLISYLVRSFMERARLLYPRAVPRDLRCVCTAVPGEHHSIGLQMFRDLLELNGWVTFYLGTDVPADQFIRFASAFEVDLIALSVMLDSHTETVGLLIEHLRRDPATADVPILLGGGAFKEENPLCRQLGADGYAMSITRGIDEAERLAGRSGKPRRSGGRRDGKKARR